MVSLLKVWLNGIDSGQFVTLPNPSTLGFDQAELVLRVRSLNGYLARLGVPLGNYAVIDIDGTEFHEEDTRSRPAATPQRRLHLTRESVDGTLDVQLPTRTIALYQEMLQGINESLADLGVPNDTDFFIVVPSQTIRFDVVNTGRRPRV